MTECVQQLYVALTERNLPRVKEILAYCNTAKLFDAYRKHRHVSVTFTAVTSLRLFPPADAESSESLETIELILKELLKAGAKFSYSHTECLPDNTIMQALRLENLDLCKMLVRLGAELKCPCYENQPVCETPLCMAACMGPAFVEFLLEQNVHPFEGNNIQRRFSFLFYAAVYRNPDVLELFMDWYEANNQGFPWRAVIEKAFQSRLIVEDNVVAILQREYHIWDEEYPEFVQLCFKLALCKGLTKVMRVLIEQQPHIVHKRWMMQIAVPAELSSSSELHNFQSWLRSLQSKPLSLKLICKQNIVRPLGRKPEASIDQLPLPNALKDYLKEKKVLD